MDLFQLIKNDHRKVNELFKKIAGTSDRALKTRERLCTQLEAEIDLHARVEEAHLYPALKKHPETRDRVPEALQEHKEAKKMLGRIAKMSPDDDGFLPLVKELEKSIKHHVAEEEKEILPAAKRALDKEEAEEIARKIRAMKSGRQAKAA